MLLDAFEKLLADSCEMVGRVTDGRALLEATARLAPDIVVADIAMPELNGLDAGRQIIQQHPGVKLIYLTVNDDPAVAALALHSGASGYLLKASAADELFAAIRAVTGGGTYVTRLLREPVREIVSERRGKSKKAPLTARQRQVIQLLAEGHSMKQAAAKLHITPRTVAFHKYQVMKHHDLHNNTDLARFAVRQGLITL
jgi:DNA-binding NarL/FixJ family response regulator